MQRMNKILLIQIFIIWMNQDQRLVYLEAFIDWQQIETCLRQREIRRVRNTTTNRKLRSKKTVQLKVINANTYAVWCEEMANKPKKKTNKK
jgi:hypothetical protein